jgi:hypothetical protein
MAQVRRQSQTGKHRPAGANCQNNSKQQARLHSDGIRKNALAISACCGRLLFERLAMYEELTKPSAVKLRRRTEQAVQQLGNGAAPWNTRCPAMRVKSNAANEGLNADLGAAGKAEWEAR